MRSDNVEKNRNTDFQYLNQLNWIWQLPVKNRRHPNEMPAFCNYTADETAGMLKKMQSDSAHHIYFVCVDLKRRNIPKIDDSAIISVLSFYAWNIFSLLSNIVIYTKIYLCLFSLLILLHDCQFSWPQNLFEQTANCVKPNVIVGTYTHFHFIVLIQQRTVSVFELLCSSLVKLIIHTAYVCLLQRLCNSVNRLAKFQSIFC